MRPPKEIDDSFTWDKTRLAWVQQSTGMIVTQQYIDDANIPITNRDYIARGRPSLIQMLWDDMPQEDRKELKRILDPRSDLIKLVSWAEKVRYSQELAYRIKDPAFLPSGDIKRHDLYTSPYVETTISIASTYVYSLDYLVRGEWVLGKDLEAKYGNLWK